MKPPSDEHDLIRWIDGEMNENERTAFEERLQGDAALAKEARELRALSANLRAHLPAEMKVPHADFFNSQIEVRIAQMDLEQSQSTNAATSWQAALQWLRQPWFAAAGAAALAVLSFVLLRSPAGTPSESVILSSYTPDTHVQARAFHDVDADATVLMLDGLQAIPSERKISGINVHRSETEPEVASVTLYGTGEVPVLMISRDATGKPLISPRG